MAEGFLVDPAQLRRHVSNLEAVRARFGAVKAASGHIAQDSGAYGMLCSWLPAILDIGHQRQDGLVAYVEENLSLAADTLSSVARVYEDVDAGSADRIRKAGDRLGSDRQLAGRRDRLDA